jgi:hypothetical protein
MINNMPFAAICLHGPLSTKTKTDIMRNQFIPGLLLLMVMGISSCAVVGGIFKAGAFVGVLAVVVVIIVILGIFSMLRKK